MATKTLKPSKGNKPAGPKEQVVRLRCLQRGCPRTRKIPLDPETMPARAVELHTYCPWHDGKCDKGNFEYFFDADGKEIDPWTEPNDPRL